MTDGTGAGTVLVKDIWSGVGDSIPSNLTNTFVPIPWDFDFDGDVDFADFAEFAGHWLEGTE